MGSTGSTNFNLQGFEENLDMYVGGGYFVSEAFDKADIDYIKNNMQSTTKPLYRAEDSSWMADKLNLKVGDTFNFNDTLKSFARSSNAISQVIREGEEMGLYQSPVIFQTSGPQQHFDVQKIARKLGNTVFDNQEESFVKGDGWKVQAISTKIIGDRRVKIITII